MRHFFHDISSVSFPVNVALHKPAFQSTTLGDAIASRAVDGWALTDIAFQSCARSLQEVNPYWQVDIQLPLYVATVAMQNAGDCCRK